MGTGGRRYPLTSFRFLVELDGLVVGGFSEITGLNAEIETEEYREGGVNAFVHRLPKQTTQSNLFLKRGMTDSALLWYWFYDASQGWITRRQGSVILLDESGTEAWRWNFSGAYPVKWQGPELRADGSTVAVETIELVHQGLYGYGGA